MRSAIEEIERLSHPKKVLHWAQAKPWKGLRLKNQTTFEWRQVRMDDKGNITEQPLLIGKPCFGQPIVYARQGQTLKRFDHNGVLRPTRCGRCLVREACHAVCNRRLNVESEIKTIYREFLAHGGALGLQDKHLKSRVQSIFDRLVKRLIQHGPFTSVNDAKVLKHYDDEHEQRKVRDAERQRAARIKKLARGTLDKNAIDLLRRHRHYRVILLRTLLNSGARLPRSLTKIPPQSVEVTADVWLARQILQHTKRKVNASSIAKVMILFKPAQYTNYGSLRQRTPADLERVDLLERLVLPGTSSPVWPRFNLLQEVADEERLLPTAI